MALQAVNSPTAQEVANAFVEQYYHILHHSPELVYRFYQDSSILSRQEDNGEITSVTTMEGINDKILSMDYKNYKAEIKTADAQDSYKDGVVVLVTGCLTGKDNLRRRFAQSFFLAPLPPQVKGYFVLNDVFRYVDEVEQLDDNAFARSNTEDSRPAPPPAVDPEPSNVHDHPPSDVATSNADNNQVNIDDESKSADSERSTVIGNEVSAESQPTENHISVAASVESPSSAQEDGQKKSYASIVKVPKSSAGPTKVYVPTVRSVSASAEKQASTAAAPASPSEASSPVGGKPSESGNPEEEVEGYSIYVRNLPLNVTVSQLEAEFQKFGPIRRGGVQVRSNRQQRTCYGFVEFVAASSMEGAIEASPINIGGRQAVVEIKRTTSRVDGLGRGGRYPPGRGAFLYGDSFRNESFRGRGGFSGGRGGYGRSDFGGRGDYSGSGRGRGSGGRGPPDGYQQRGRGRAVGPAGQNRDGIWETNNP
ncbi:hypothetical protein Dimus_031028 [Dionaea muscipula]